MQTKMATIVIMSVACLLSGCGRPEPRGTPWRVVETAKSQGLKGPVAEMSVEETAHLCYARLGRRTRLGDRRFVCSFDKRGLLTEACRYWRGERLERSVYTYSTDGRLLKEETWDKPGKPRVTDYRYSPAGGLASMTRGKPDGSISYECGYTYDPATRTVTETFCGAEARGAGRNVVKLDFGHRILQRRHYDANARLWQLDRNTYDRRGRLLAQTLYDPKNANSSEGRLTYDARGLVVKSVHRSRYESMVTTYTYSGFDKHGNWTTGTKCVVCKDPSLLSPYELTKITRRITYRNTAHPSSQCPGAAGRILERVRRI